MSFSDCLRPQPNKIAIERGQARTDRHAHQNAPKTRIRPSLPTQAIKPLSKPDDPNLCIPIKICAALVRVCPNHLEFPSLALEFLHFCAFGPATWHAV